MSAPLRQWLDALGLARYADRFVADDIDLDVLPSLSEQDLAELGVSMGHRKRLLKAIPELTGTAATPSPAPAAAGTTATVSTPRTTATAEARKVVTIVFADLIGSTSLHEQLDAESVTRLMERYYATMRGAVEGHGGTIVKLLGDGVMAAFGVPRVAEDDAIRAVRAGVAMQAALRDFACRELAGVGDVGLRVGINTGEVVVIADDTDVVGDPVNVAARLQAEAGDGDVLLGEATRRVVASLVTLTPLGRFALKGRSESINAYRVESLERPVGVAAAAFVGRDDELARLAAVYESACTAPAARLAVLLGSPGLGKSRLIAEVGRRLGDAATVVTAHCDAAGGATFAPIAAALREHFQIEAGTGTNDVQATIAAAIPEGDPERTRIAAGIAALVADSPSSPEETFFVIRRLLAGLATTKPVLLVIDDLHWAEPLLLDLVEHLVQWGSGTPLLVLVGARPELRDLRSSLVTPGGLVADVVTLGGLDAGAAMRLAASVIGAADLPAAVAAKVLATSEGNPLFVGELVRMLVDEGAIERRGERWVVGANLAAFEMPPTIHALLAARIERLGPDDRIVLERAAVVGRHFSRSAVAALLGRGGTQLDARLEALRRSELIERDTGWFLGEPVLRFHHVLIRDAAYRRLLKDTRAALHEQLADWIEAQVGDAAEHDETIGWHLEQAHQLRRELGPLDASGRALGERAARRLGAAGRRALARDDAPVAAGLLGRALERLVEDDPTRAELALDWCEALLASGDVATAERAVAELARFVGDPASARDPRLAAWHTCFRGQLTVLTAPQSLLDTADTVAAAAGELAQLGDAAGEAKGHFVHALALARLGRIGGCEAALDKALAAARRADDRRRANTVLAIAPLAALWGPSPVTRASGRCLDVVRVLRITQGAPAVEAVALSCQAVLEALRGRADAARRMIAAARKMVEDLGLTQRLLETEVLRGLIDLLEGDAPAAERALRTAYHGLRDLGLGIDAARAAALLARALLALDRVHDAEALSHESEALAGDDLKAAIAWRGVRAEALARRGEHAAAVELAQAAVGIAAATDALLDHADARLALAAALRAAGRGRDADAEERRAIELWEAKGAVLLVERTRRAEARGAATAATTRPIAAAPQPGGARARRRRVTPNRATAALIPFNDALAARDLEAFRAQFSESYAEIDHPSGAAYGRDANVASLERLLRSRDARCHVEPLATLGDALVLTRRTIHASATSGGRFDVGAYEQEAYTIAELDESGRWCRHEVFAADHLTDARVRLFERYAALLPEGPERTRAVAAARSLEVFRRSETDPDILVVALAPDFEGVDHRHLSSHTLRGAAAYIEHLRAWREVADDLVFRERDVLALAQRTMLVATLHTGTARNGGGAYERPFLTLFVLDEGGRLARAEWFDDDREAEALARFDELTAGDTPRARVVRRMTPNAATATADRFGAAVAARDLDALADTLCDEIETLHHQTGVQYGRKGLLATWRSMFRAATMLRRQETIASLGDTLALARHTIRLEGFTEEHIADVGAVDIDEVVLFEVDERGRTLRFGIFPMEKLGDALVRLYERHAELLPDGAEKTRVARITRNLATWNGPLDLDRVRAAYDPSTRFLDHRVFGTWAARDVDEVMQHFRLQLDLAPDFSGRFDDVLAADVHAMVARMTFFGTARDSGGPFENALCVTFTFGDDGRTNQSEVFEAEQGAEALARLDELTGTSQEDASPFENDAGIDEARARFAEPSRGTNAPERFADRFVRVTDARDWNALADLFAPDLRFDDRRPLLRMELPKEGFLEQFRTLFDVPNARWTATPLATRGERLALFRLTLNGDVGDDGGLLEIEHLWVGGVRDDGRCDTIVLFAPGDLDAARAEFDARYVAGEGARHRSLVKPTAATAALERLYRHFDAQDWDGVRAACSRDFTWQDRRPIVGISGDVELMMASARERMASGARHERREIIGTAGDRVAIGRVLWAGGPAGGRFEVEFLSVFEIDADGLLTAMIFLEPDDLRAAQREAWARWAAIDPTVAAMTKYAGAVIDAWNAQDPERMRAVLSEDLVAADHRRTGIGRSEGREAYLRSVMALWELAPDSHLEAGLVWLAHAPHAGLYLCRRAGVLPDGGEFVSEFLALAVVERGLTARIEVFETDAADAALARFAELRPDPLRIPPNAATRTWDRWCAAAAAGDWDTITALYDPSYRSEDRRPLIRLTTDRAGMLENDRILAEGGWRPTPTLLATAGDRLALQHILWRTGEAGGDSEIEILHLTEVDDEGRFASSATFDPGDRAAAFRELGDRHRARTRPSAVPQQEARRAAGRDLARLRAAFPDDFFFHDHRRTGLGRIDGADAYVRSVAALHELAPDAIVGQPLHFLADEPHGTLSIAHSFGTLADGGRSSRSTR